MKLLICKIFFFFSISCAFVCKRDRVICSDFNLKLEQSYDNKFYVFDSIYMGMPYNEYITYYNPKRPIGDMQKNVGCDPYPIFPTNLCLNDSLVILGDCRPRSTKIGRVTGLSISICFWDKEGKLNYKYINQVMGIFMEKASKGLHTVFVKGEFDNFICETDKIKIKIASVGGHIKVEIVESE
jgi:hypothetical protein